MTLYPHLFQLTKHHAGRSLSRLYHRSSKAQGRSLTAEVASEPSIHRSHDASDLSRTTVTAYSTNSTKPLHYSRPSLSTAGTLKKPQRSRSTAIHDSPLFSRRLAGKRFPFGASVSSDPPKYRIQQGQEESVRLRSLDFNPFGSYRSVKEGPPNYFSPSSSTEVSGIWTINSLPSEAQYRADILRSTGARKSHPVRPPISSDSVNRMDPLYSADDNRAWFTQPVAVKKTPPQIFNSYQLDPVQEEMVEALIKRLSDYSTFMTMQDLVGELHKLGRVTLLRWRLPAHFLDEPVNQNDIIGTGIDTLISTLPSFKDAVSDDFNNHWVGSFVSLLSEHDLLRLVDKTGLSYLNHHVAYPVPASRNRTARSIRKTGLESIREVQALRCAKRIDHQEWEVRTRLFRIQLASARETGVIPSESEYLSFMKSCRQAGQIREMDLTFRHFMDHHPSAAQLRRRQVQQQQLMSDFRTISKPRSDRIVPSDEEASCELIYREYIKGLVSLDMMDHAHEVLDSMRKSGVTPSVITFGVMLNGYGRRMNMQKLRLTLKAMYNAGHTPTLEIYTSLMANYIRAGELKRADEVYRQLMERSDITLDLQSENVVKHLLRMGGGQDVLNSSPHKLTWEGAELHKVARLVVQDHQGMKRLNILIGYNHVLKHYARSVNMRRVVETFSRIKRVGLKPNTITFNTLMDALVKHGQVQDSLNLLEHMKTTEEGQPDVVTYSMLIKCAVENKDAELGWNLYSKMRKQRIEPSLHTYVSLVELVGLDPSSQLGRNTVRRFNIPGNQRIRFPIQGSLEERVGLNFAMRLYNQLCNQGLKPNQHIFCALLNLVVRGGYSVMAPYVYQEMAQQGVEPNTAILTTLLKGFEIRKDFESGWRVWMHMLNSNIPRNVVTYYHLIRLCERSLADPDVAASILKILPTEKETKTHKRSRRRAGTSEDKQKDAPRIPEPLMDVIREQMRLDHVHWPRVQQFRRIEVDRNIWTPIPVEVGPVISMAVAQEAAEAAVMGEANRESNPQRAHAHQDVQLDGHDLGTRHFSDTVMIQEIFTGSGDRFQPKRQPPPNMNLAWNMVKNMPLLKSESEASSTTEDKA
ncbi:hypothetical protein EDD11_006328 [Mortierella claussenii]|nr:hypothetical protein EDD11_006328 [Mortierella claussenii]